MDMVVPLQNKCELLETCIRERAERDAEERQMNQDRESMFN